MSECTYIAPDVKMGVNVKLTKYINLFSCTIGENAIVRAGNVATKV